MTELMRGLVTGLITLAMGNAQATLIDRGDGLIYDSALNITWLQNPLLARTNNFGLAGVSANGAMTWETAQLWIDAMNVQAFRGFGNWRLPSAGPSTGVLALSFDGTTDYGYNITRPANEMAYLFYVTLENAGLYDVSGNLDVASNQANTKGVFQSFLDTGNAYWTGTTSEVLSYAAYSFSMSSGQADLNNKISEMYAWAVRDGDVADASGSVPEPSSLMLLGLALIGIGATRRRKLA